MTEPAVRHICHISTTFNQRSGSARRTSAILAACVRRGFRVSLIVGEDHDSSHGDPPGVAFESVPSLAKTIRPWRDAAALTAITRLLRELRPDLVHTHLAKAGIVGRWAARRAGVPKIVHTVHGPTFPGHLSAPARWLFRALERVAAGHSHALVFVGEDLRRRYLDADIGSATDTRVIRTGRPAHQLDFEPTDARDPDLRLELCDGERCELLLVQIGRLVPSKRPAHGIAALDDLRRRGVDARLALVGEALVDSEKGYGSRLRRRFESHGFVHFTGFRDDVLEIMSCADVVLLTSTHEGLPNVAVEAALACTPVAGYDVLGLGEVVEHGRTGWIVHTEEPPALADAVLELRQEMDAVRARLRARRLAVASAHDQRRMTSETLALYDELLS
ncbi:MAG: glycosyltransferase family 4 protein [bacterium]|nr:glycosyltransferase family 4 protein [bacterium]